VLKVAYEDGLLTLDFPRDHIYPVEFTDQLDCFAEKPIASLRGTEEYLLVFETEEQIARAVCDLEKAAEIDLCGFIITAPSSRAGLDFVSRYFSPKYGIDEDPVTGSAHTLLVPYWQEVMGQDVFHAMQISKRGGKLYCRAEGDRVKIGGQAVTFFAGELLL
jgi:PhzF family phenazine biosynthesis protein